MKNGIAYSFLTVKSVNETKRIISGMATTPTPDRVGDIVIPTGAKFQNPMPLLLHHDHRQPVGQVTFGKPTDKGIPFEAEIFDIATPQHLRDRLDEAYQSVKSGLIRAVSIGFRAIKYAFLDEGGVEFQETEIYELSLVTVPANAEATIETIKSLDAQFREKAASGLTEKSVQAVKPAGVTAKPVKLSTKKEGNPMNIAEQIKKALADRLAKHEEMKALMKKATDAGETLAGADAEKYDELQGEVKALDQHVERLKGLQAAEGEEAKPVVKAGETVTDSAAASAARGGGDIRVKIQDNGAAEKGIGFARLVKCYGLAKGNTMQALEIAKANYKHDQRVQNVLKAAVAAGTTLDSTWAGPLVGDESNVFADFVSYLRPQTILGRFGANGIPSLRRVPFRTRLISQTSGGSAGWVGEGRGKPVTKFDVAGTTLEPLKVAAIAVITQELLRDSSPSADVLVRDELVNACRERLDLDFIDPSKGASAGISPASITNGVTPIPSSGTDADAVRRDVKALLAAYIAANNPPTSGVIIMSSLTALSISMMTNAFGQREFADVTMGGGMLEGIPVITSEYVPTDSSGSLMIMVNAQDIWVGDEGGFSVDMSTETSIEMSDAPTQRSDNGTGASMVSMFQTNSAAFRAERTINWAKRRTSAVAYVSGVFYGDDSGA